MITVVGLGIEKDDLTIKGKKAIKNATYIFSRDKRKFATECASVLFSDAQTFEKLDELIVEHLLLKEKEYNDVVYAVVGDGYCDRAVGILSKKTNVEIIAGVSDNRGRDFSGSSVFMSAYDIDEHTYFDTARAHSIYQIDGKDVACDIKISLLNWYDGETQVVLSDKKISQSLPLYEIDRQKKYDCACLFIPAQSDFTKKKRYEMNDLLCIMRRLTAPDGCPWDKEQTHESIRINMIEEAYEAVDAIDNADVENLIEELGDVLMQVVFHADMSEREGTFNLNDIVSGVCEKLISRHTHVFGENKASDAEGALSAWDKAKEKEKNAYSYSEHTTRLPDNFPSTLYAQKVLKKAKKFGIEIDKETVYNALENAVKDKNAKDVLLFSVFYATLVGLDSEVEINESAKKVCKKFANAIENNEKEQVVKEIFNA